MVAMLLRREDVRKLTNIGDFNHLLGRIESEIAPNLVAFELRVSWDSRRTCKWDARLFNGPNTNCGSILGGARFVELEI
jgi:hypothetical protein